VAGGTPVGADRGERIDDAVADEGIPPGSGVMRRRLEPLHHLAGGQRREAGPD
jgi:hypothetical protein